MCCVCFFRAVSMLYVLRLLHEYVVCVLYFLNVVLCVCVVCVVRVLRCVRFVCVCVVHVCSVLCE